MNKAKNNKIRIVVAAALIVLFAIPSLGYSQACTSSTDGNGNVTGDCNPTTTSTNNGGTRSLATVPSGFSGIFSCNQNGAYSMSVGALGATGGVYVPVADATVELNTGTLVYKECVLREVVDAERQAATAGFAQQATNNIQSGRYGASLAAVQPIQEKVQAETAVVQTDLQQNGTLSPLDASLQTPVMQAVARGWVLSSQQPNAQLKCTIPDSLQTVVNGQTTDTLSDLAALTNPACNAYGATLLANSLVMQDVDNGNALLNQELLWGGGYYPVTSGGANPLLQKIVTPSSNVSNSYATVLNSGFNQLQNANDIGQMVGALFGGISTQVLSGTSGGITGLNQNIGNSPSYLQQLVTQESRNLQSTISNVALVNLESALATEQAYYNLMSQIAGSLQGTISSLRGSENECWQQITQALCPSGPSANGTCTDVNGVQIKIATSTEFSQPVVNSQIASLASTTINNLSISRQALALINQLIQNVTGTSADSQALAVEQLNTLVANNELHTPSDLTTAQTQSQSVSNAMQTLSQNTPALWAGTDPNNTANNNIPWNGSVGATLSVSSPGVGWCNFKNQTTLSAWENAWKI